ncbi:MAG: TIGR03936 family radical SAM-associated protein [Chloroflexota bacterium]|nr:TIGR03936 family radical SAM-associated protein [Chloroflexota bacterium]
MPGVPPLTEQPGSGPQGASSAARFTRRLRFDKTGPARYLPHNDLITAFVRALRRINAPLAYSQGFSPKPRMRFGPPLPVGHCGRGEVVDVELSEPGPANLADLLDQACPGGLSVVAEDRPVVGRRSPMAAARAYRYQVRLTDPTPDLAATVQRFMELESVPATVRRGPGKVRRIDVRKVVQDLLANGQKGFEVEIAIGEGTLCRPEDVAEALGVSAQSCTRVNVEYEF